MAPEYSAPQYVVTGYIDAAGKVKGGTGGFTVEHVDAGVYTVIFQPAFLTTPVVVTSQVFPDELYSKGGSTLDNALLIGVDNTRVRIHTGDGSGKTTDRVFTFIAMGAGPAEDSAEDEGADHGAHHGGHHAEHGTVIVEEITEEITEG